ncbi:UDP-N-acetylmuramate dehydrogenase [Planctomycetota bacterium]|nr:UDP-N-acetylmuramate dehydrogenase [Planctomycetota bacterium]
MIPRALRDKTKLNHSLSALTTYRIGGAARFYIEPETIRDVAMSTRFGREQGLPIYVLGGGSNLLIDDAGVDGIVLNLRRMKSIRRFDTKVCVQAGTNLGMFINDCNRNGLAGPHGLAGIPGSIGGALAMNAGGRYAEIFDFVESVIWITPEGELQSRYKEEIEFGYRISELRHGVVLEATLTTQPADPSELIAETRRIQTEKLSVQPYRKFSAGCAFKNPKDKSAGLCIDEAGCKGLSVGDATVSMKHGNFIVNEGKARARDIKELMELVTEKVKQVHGVSLQPEVQFWPRVAA